MTDPLPLPPPITITTRLDQILALDPATVPAPGLEPLDQAHEEQQFFLNMILAVHSILDDVDDSFFAALTPQQDQRCQAIWDTLAVNGPRAAFMACWDHVSAPAGDAAVSTVPLCLDTEIKVLWWKIYHCTTLPGCIWHFLSVDENWLNFGYCAPDGTGDDDHDEPCDCRQCGIPLEVLIILISIAAIWMGGPAVGAAGMALLRRIALRTAAAGIG